MTQSLNADGDLQSDISLAVVDLPTNNVYQVLKQICERNFSNLQRFQLIQL